MLKPTAKQVIVAVGCGVAMMLIAAWLSGSQGEICEQTKSGQEHCAVYNLSVYFLFKIGGFLNDSAVVISAIATAFIAWFTWTLWQSNEKMWSATKVSADAAKKSAEVAERALTLADRPWVDFKIDIMGPLKFDDIQGCSVEVKLMLLNIGRSPAIGLGYYVELCPSVSQATERHGKMIQSSQYMFGGMFFGHTRFPNDPLETQIILTLDRSKIEKGIQESESKLVEPYIVACAYYGLPTGGRFRHTSGIRAIFLKDQDSRGFKPVGEYPADKLFLSNFNPGETT
jgi:hypothetical protein